MCLICGVVLLVVLRQQGKTIQRTPVALAKQILRYPERILIDIPVYASSLHGSMSCEFLLETESVLASMGELKMRRQFLIHFAEVVKSPSKDSVKKLTNFLFYVAPETFRDVLRWDGKCDNAVHFLEFMQNLIATVEEGKKLRDFQKVSKKKRRLSPKNSSKKLEGVDAEIMQEWFDLHIAVNKEIASWQAQSLNVTREWNGSAQFKSANLINEDKIPHLLPFLIAAREVYKPDSI